MERADKERGCVTVILSMDSDECLKCPHHDNCDEKRMVACALLEMSHKQILQPIAQPVMNPIMMPIANNFRSVKIQIEPRISIGDIEQEIVKNLRPGCHFRESW